MHGGTATGHPREQQTEVHTLKIHTYEHVSIYERVYLYIHVYMQENIQVPREKFLQYFISSEDRHAKVQERGRDRN